MTNKLVSPFTIISASIQGGYQVGEQDQNGKTIDRYGIDIVNYHEDKVDGLEGTPLQSPFTEKWVGGFPHRHIDINTGSAKSNERPEAWHLQIKASNPIFHGIEVRSHRYRNSPPAYWTRDEFAKRPLNIKNIQTTTSSVSHGNYRFNYEVVQSSGRFVNSFLKNLLTGSENIGQLRSRFVSASNVDLDNTRRSLATLDSIKNKTVIVSRFNAPGGVNESSRASLDVESEEVSPNIPLTYRNESVRKELLKKLSGSMTQGNANNMVHGVNRNTLRKSSGIVQKDNFYVQRPIPRTDIQYAWISASAITKAIEMGGYQSGAYGYSAEYNDIVFAGTTDDRVVNINKKEYEVDFATNTLQPVIKINLDSYKSTSYPTGNVGEQGFFLTGRSFIKPDSGGNPWIVLMGGTGELEGKATIAYRFTTPITLVVTTADRSVSLQEGGGVINGEDLVLDISTNEGQTWSFYTTIRFGGLARGSASIITKSYSITETRPFYIRFRTDDLTTTIGWTLKDVKIFYRPASVDNGDYQFSTWKQIRVGEHEVAKKLRDTNRISIIDTPKPRATTLSGYSVSVPKRDEIVSFIEPPVSMKYKPLKHKFIFKGNSNPLLGHEVVHTYNNNLSMFANKDLNDRIGAEEIRDQFYDRLREFYSDSETSEDDNPIAKFLGYTQEEVVYPKEENTGLEKIRKRRAYILNKAGFDRDGYDRQFGTQRVFWRDNYYHRMRSLSGSYNSQNEFIGAFQITATFHDNMGAGEAGYEGPYAYHSYMSSTLGQNIGQNSILPIEELRNYILLLTGSLINTGSYNAPFTSSQRVYTFENAGELNNLTWIDTFANDAGIFGGQSHAAQLIRNSDLSLFLLQTNARITDLQTLGGSLASHTQGNALPYIWYFENSGSVYPRARIRYCAFLGGWETGSRSSITNRDPFSARPIGKVTSSLDFGLSYQAHILSGKKPWYDSYEEYVNDIKALNKSYSVLPEFRISEHMRYYVSQSGGNFRAQNNAFLSLDGIGNEYRSSLSENGFFSNNFFKTYVNSDTIKNHDILRKQNNKLTKLDKISFRVSGIKKMLPYNGFYPIQRTVQLANLYSEYINERFHGGYYISPKQYLHDPGSRDSYIVNTNLANAAFKQTALEPLFSPGILYNTIKAGIACDWPAVTASFRTIAGDYGSLDFPQFTYIDESLPLSYRPFISMRIPFEAIIDPTLGFTIKDELTASIGSNAESTGHVKNSVRDSYFMGHFDASSHSFIQQGNDDQDYVASVPFTYIKKNSNTTNLYSLSMNNFLAETVRFFLEDQKMNAFVSKEESKWKVFDKNKIYYMDIVLKKDPNLVMIQAFTSSFTLSGRTNITASIETNTMHGRYFGYPVDMVHERLQVQNNRNFTIHHDPAFAPYTPPYFEGEAVLRIRFAPTTTQKYTLDEIFQQVTVDSIFSNLSALIHTESVAFRNKMGIDSSINIFGQTRLNEIEFDATRLLKPSIVKQSTDSTRNAWVIGPKMETPVLDFSNQPMIQKLGDYWVGAGFGRGMWSGYGQIPSGSKGIYFELRESFPMQLVQKGSRSGSLIQQCGFIPQSKKVGQIAESKEISEAIVVIPYLDYQIVGLTTEIGGLNFIKVSKSIFNVQKKNIENNEPAIKIGNLGSKEEIQETSISKMIEAMNNYVIPPHYNFIQYPDIDPFVMYIFEFKHTLDQQDLADIWQGLMPKIATTAQLDEVEIEHPAGRFEFFHGRELPKNLRWMVFKIKKKAEKSYYKITADSTDDDRFVFDFQIGRKEPEYSFNWPYDYFSLVEFAKVELSLDYTNKETEDKIAKGANITRNILSQTKKLRGRKKK